MTRSTNQAETNREKLTLFWKLNIFNIKHAFDFSIQFQLFINDHRNQFSVGNCVRVSGLYRPVAPVSLSQRQRSIREWTGSQGVYYVWYFLLAVDEARRGEERKREEKRGKERRGKGRRREERKREERKREQSRGGGRSVWAGAGFLQTLSTEPAAEVLPVPRLSVRAGVPVLRENQLQHKPRRPRSTLTMCI